MIAKLRGIIDEIKPTEMILDVHGTGYHLHIPLSTYEIFRSEKSEISLYVHTYHKEDQFKLYGFHNESSKNLFSILINISGIGPSIAMSILSGITIERLVESVKTGNTLYLVKIPGIGKAKAEKLVFELKRKIDKLGKFTEAVTGAASDINDAVDALVTLGFDEAKSRRAIDEISRDHGRKDIEFLIKEALRVMSG